MAANALVELATSGILDADKTSTPATKNETITATPNDHVDNIADGTVKVPKQGTKIVVLKPGSSKHNEGKKEEPPVKAQRTAPENHAN